MVVLGADGTTRNGWVVAEVALEGPGVRWHHVVGMAALLELARDRGAGALAVDVPIGLPEEGRPRPCDQQAKALLRSAGRGSSVFPAPPRAALRHATYRAARPHHPSLSAQAFALSARIADVDGALGPADHERVVECHPELVFARLLVPPVESKHSATGLLRRLAAVERLFGPLPRDVPAGAALDDALDALACAWTARRWALGTAEVLGGELDSTGVPMRIVS